MAIKPFAMCHHTGFVYMYFTVTSQDEVEALLRAQTYICNFGVAYELIF